ncbi:hypothetical protein KQI65_03040 [bacterium]|nr:hypothetical protein [bacterium]
MLHIRSILATVVVALLFAGCSDDEMSPVGPTPVDPNMAEKVSIDRFSATAGNLFVRTSSNGLPAANEAINFDSGPFITHGLGPNGEKVSYYNFDVQPLESAPIFVLFRDGESSPVADQLNIVDDIPGDSDYNDFWNVQKVTVPADYVANTVTSYQEIMDAGYAIEKTDMIVNCPIVPEGSTATMRLNGGSTALTRGWYQGKIVFYFNFLEKELHATPPATGFSMVPISPIYVAFNINPDMMGGGPPSGFMTEMGSMQTHNVTATIPSDASYSPLWFVNVYDNNDFSMVMDLSSATSANILATGVANVNCPIVSVQ